MTNYEITRNLMREEFTKYDQQEMIGKYGLLHDEQYLYMEFMQHLYRIGRDNGVVEWSDDDFVNVTEADYSESMTIYDVLCYAKKDASLSGRYSMANGLKGTVHSSGLGDSLYQESAEEFAGKLDKLTAALTKFGERIDMKGDVAVKIDAFDFLPVIIQFWDADDEFPANLKFMFDENVMQFMHYETLYYLMGHMIRRIKEEM